ncbi:MAG: hypothetical protein E7Y34_01880 [Mycoplasma sp.]|nr:hypothetical protein [Mycoplasma sp.]
MKYYFKSFYGPFINFLMPIILIFLLANIIALHYIIPGVISAGTMIIGLFSLPIAIVELKTSVLLKKIQSFPVKKNDLTFSIIIFFLFQIVITTLWILFFVYFLYLPSYIWIKNFYEADDLKNWWEKVSQYFYSESIKRLYKVFFQNMKEGLYWLVFIYGGVLNGVLSIAIGIAIASISSSLLKVNVLALMIIFPFLFLSGQFVPPQILEKYSFLEYLSYFVPYRYTTLLLFVGFNGKSLYSTEFGGGHPFVIWPNLNIHYFSKYSLDYVQIITQIDKEEVIKHIKPHIEEITNKLQKKEINKLFDVLIQYLKNPAKNKLNLLELKNMFPIIDNFLSIISLLEHKGVLREGFIAKLIQNNGSFSEVNQYFKETKGFYWWEVILAHTYPLTTIITALLINHYKFSISIRGNS